MTAVTAAATLVGWAAGTGAGALLAGHLGAPGGLAVEHSVLTGRAVAIGCALAALTVVVMLAALRTDSISFGGVRLTVVDVAALGALGAVLLALARGKADANALAAGGTGVVLLLLPGLVLFVLAVVIARVLAPLLSTLLHLLAGLDLPTAGDVVVGGTTLSQLDATARAELRRDRIGLVTQGTDLVPFLTAQESVELALAQRGVERGEASERAAGSLADVGLGELAQQRVARLSMGERQRVALAHALAARPSLLFADEPTARLDEANARTIGALFADLASTMGTAIVCATHDPVLIEHAAVEVALGTVAA